MHFEIYRDHAGEWRWTLYAANSRNIADSGKEYHIQRLMPNCATGQG